MGVDIVGKDPSSQIGRYFGRNWSSWIPLAAYMIDVVPQAANHCRHWFSNDGDGLDASQAHALADALEFEIASGRCKAYARARKAQIDALQAEVDASPDLACPICDGSGIWVVPAIDVHNPFPFDAPAGSKISCWRCGGTGSVRPDGPYQWHSVLSVENVKRFIAFLRDCGGFAIW